MTARRTRNRFCAWNVALLAALGCGLAATGCGGKSGSLPPARYLSDDASEYAPAVADLSRPFSVSTSDTEQGEDAGLPVAAARSFAHSAGGAWVVVAPDALDPVKGFDSVAMSSPYSSLGGQQSPSVADAIDKISKAGTPIAYDASRSYVFMVFGDQTALAKMRDAPPDPVTGLYLCGNNPQAALAALADARRETITLDPQLGTGWSEYKKRSDALRKAIRQLNPGSGMEEYARELMMRGGTPPGFEFSNTRKASEADLMNAIAGQIGGAAAQTGAGAWRIAAYAPGPSLDARLKQLKSAIDEAASIGNDSVTSTGAWSSYAERHGEGESGSGESVNIREEITSTSPQQMQELEAQISQQVQADPSVQKALDQLGVIGAGAVPTLTGYLTAATPPSVSCAALRVLAAMPSATSGARDAMYGFIDATIATPAKSGQEIQQLAVLSSSSDLLASLPTIDGGAPDARAQDALQKLAGASDLPQSIRESARLALLRYGVMPAAPAGQAKWNPAAELAFSLTPPPAAPGHLNPITQTAPDAIAPLATTVSPSGEAWGVFLSDRYGSPTDMWLAHATGGVWREFLFTGKKYQVGQEYSYDGSQTVAPGGCTIRVVGDAVVVAPTKAGASVAASLAKLQAALTAAERSMAANPSVGSKMEGLETKMQQMQQQGSSMLTDTYTFSLADLRRDSVGDGMTDVTKNRLGIDLKAHGAASDQNPLVPAGGGSQGDSDRRAMLQQIFAACFGGDGSVNPIVVVLDTPFQQRFSGGPARVLCVTSAQYAEKAANLSSLRSLQFGGPTDADSSVLHPDGPCLYTPDGQQAEVHFWTTTGAPAQPYESFTDRLSGQTSDEVALFQRGGNAGGWTLKSIDRLHFRSSQSQAARQLIGGVVVSG